MSLLKRVSVFVLLCSVALSYAEKNDISVFSCVGQAGKLFGSNQTEGNDLPPENVAPKRGNDSPIDNETAPTASTAASGWYCKHTTDGVRPPCPPEMSYIEQYDGYYLGNDEKKIYLTFDAGYENGNVEKILDTLKAENVPAAFFILDNLVLSNGELVERMINEGHLVCNHTAKHKDVTKMASFEEFKTEMEKMETIYTDAFGSGIAHYFRPPEGKISEQSLEWAQQLGYKTIMWSYAYADWDNNNQMSADDAVKKVLAGTHNGEILLLHPTSATNAEILPTLIKEWRAMGYTFGTLDDLGANNG